MKIQKTFVLREIAGDYVLVPVGQTALEFNGMITMNEVGAFLWQKLQEDITKEELLAAVLEEYEVNETEALADIDEYLELLKKRNILEV